MVQKKIPSYDEFLEKYPDWVLESTNLYAREATPELTERSRLNKKAIVGCFLLFMQNHGLVRRVLCDAAPDIPDDFSIYLRDVTPDGLAVFRTGYLKWIGRLDKKIGSDLSNVKELEVSLTKLRASKDASIHEI